METAIHGEGPEEGFRLSAIRPVVACHVVLVLATSLLSIGSPKVAVLQIFAVAVPLAQWALLLIWLLLCEGKSLKRMIAVAAYAELALTVPQIPGLSLLNLFHLVQGMVSLVWGTGVLVFFGEIMNLPLSFAYADGLRVRRVTPGDLTVAPPLQFSVSRLLWMTALAAILFGIIPAKESQTSGPARTIATLVMITVGMTIVFGWTRACVWIALQPGQVAVRLAVAVYLWGLGFLLIVCLQGVNLLNASMTIAGFAAATGIVVVTLLLMRRRGYYAVWPTQSGQVVASHAGDKPAHARL